MIQLSSILTKKSVDAASGVVLLSRDDGISELMSEISKKIESDNEIPVADILKKATRRLVFRIQVKGYGSLIVKSFPLTKFRHRLKHKKYAYNEALNLLMASGRGLKVPKVFAYCFKKSIGLTRYNAVCMEDILGVSLHNLLIDTHSDIEKMLILQKITGVLKSFYLAGCNHIDLKGDGIIFRDNEKDSPHVIDFQYCTFHDVGSYQIMAAQAGHLCRDLVANKCITRSVAYEWFKSIFENDDAKQCETATTFDKFLNNRVSIKERMSM
ncbi:hypothetical protein [Candidatus Spongiihabitans sp.]|uniref:hypothetical protein n=1 Tax=Candidatus Spongiihabitans sp. TaxID=3101308 RepID=UPI003C7E2620